MLRLLRVRANARLAIRSYASSTINLGHSHRDSTTESTDSSILKLASYVDLPPPSEWRKYFRSDTLVTRDRASVKDPDTANAMAEAFVPAGSEGKVVIEAYPGMLVC